MFLDATRGVCKYIPLDGLLAVLPQHASLSVPTVVSLECVTVLCLVCAFAAQVLACLAFTSMCVTALLLGRRPNETQGRILAGVVAAACMVPCRVLLPKLYQSANAPLAAAMIDKAVGRARRGDKAAPSGTARAVSCRHVYCPSAGPETCDRRGTKPFPHAFTPSLLCHTPTPEPRLL